MLERLLAATCIATAFLGTLLGMVYLWLWQNDTLGKLFVSCMLLFAATGSIFSVINSSKRNRL